MTPNTPSPQQNSPLQRQMTITLSVVIVSLLLLVAVPMVLISVQLQRQTATFTQQATADKFATALSELIATIQSGNVAPPESTQTDPRIKLIIGQISVEMDQLIADVRTQIEQAGTVSPDALLKTPTVLGVLRYSADGNLAGGRWLEAPLVASQTLVQTESFDLARRGETATTLLFGETSAIPLLMLAIPEETSGAVTVVIIDASGIWQSLAALAVGERGNLYIIDHRAHAIITPPTEAQPDITAIESAIESGTVYHGWYGTPVVGHAADIKNTPWRVVVELPQAEATAGLRSLLIILGAILLFALALAITIARIFSGWLLQPIRVLRDSAERISRGDLAHRISLERDDELGFLASAFNQMVATLEKTITDLRTVSQRLLSAEEAERRRIAHEIHDELGQTLTALRFSLSMVARNSPQPESLQAVQNMAAEAQEKARTLSHELRPAMLDDIGLVATLEWYIDRVEQRANLAISLDAELDEQAIPIEIKTTVYRLVVEALTNIHKHAAASSAEILMRQTAQAILLTIIDDGRGFDVTTLAHTPSLGVAGMRERVNLLRGEFSIESQPEHGTKIDVVLPV